MKEIKVAYNDGEVSGVGIIMEADVRETVIKTEEGKIIKMDSDYVTLVHVNMTKEYVEEWLDVIATHYLECEITEVEKEEINRIVDYIKTKI